MENKALKYAKRVLTGELVAPSQVKKQCENFIHEFEIAQHDESYEYMWSEENELLIYDILKNLNFARGAATSESMYERLTLSQWFLILVPFCTVYKEFPTKRKIKEVIFTVARKNSKSVIAGIYHILCFFFDEENQTAYIGSNTKQQATIIFDELVSIIKSSPNLMPYFEIKKSYMIFHGMNIDGSVGNKNCKIQPLSGDASKADGTMVFHASVDELGASNDIYKMVSSLETGMFGPKNPLILKISTSYPIVNAENYWKNTVDGMIENTKKGNENPRQWGLAYLIDEPFSDVVVDGVKMKRWQDKSVWPESNPLIAEVDSLWKELEESYETKKHIPRDFHLFKTKNLNLWQSEQIDDGSRFVDINTLEKCKFEAAEDWKWWEGKLVFIGIDLAPVRDNSAVTFAYYDVETKTTYIKNVVFYAKSEEMNKSNTEGLKYYEYKNNGWCKPSGDTSVDFIEIGEFIKEITDEHQMKIATILYDEAYSSELVRYIKKNIKMQLSAVKVRQSAKLLGPALVDVQSDIYKGKFHYAPNRFVEAAFTNGIIEYRMGKPYIQRKSQSKNKIDSLVATFNAYTGIKVFVDTHRFEKKGPIVW